VEVEAVVLGRFRSNLTYTWNASKGAIVAGQGSPKVTILTPKTKPRFVINVTLNVGGLDSNCRCDATQETSIFVKGPHDSVNGGPPRLADLVLNKKEIAVSTDSESAMVNVIAIPQDVGDEEVLSFNYTVSGGEIVGTGPRVK